VLSKVNGVGHLNKRPEQACQTQTILQAAKEAKTAEGAAEGPKIPLAVHI